MPSSAHDYLHHYLAKAASGAGSRGGHIIGTTRSGKPIYGEGHKKYSALGYMKAPGEKPAVESTRYENREHVKQAFPGYSAADHREAANTHKGQATRALNRRKKSDYSDGAAYSAHSFHDVAFRAHKDAGQMMAAEERNRD